jgi:hypothetical protein
MTAYRMDHGHYAWSPVVARPRLEWPHGARVAVAFVVSLGHYEADPPADAFDPPTHASPLRVIPYPDYPTVTHREYGYRVGIFRLFDLFDTYGMKATAAVDALTARRYAGLVAESRKRGWELAAHGIGQRQALSGATTESAERAYIRATLDALTMAGVLPTGWLGAEQSESVRTPTLLAAAGLGYVGDWATTTSRISSVRAMRSSRCRSCEASGTSICTGGAGSQSPDGPRSSVRHSTPSIATARRVDGCSSCRCTPGASASRSV